MRKKIINFLPIIAFSIIPSLLIWLPFFLRLESFWSIPLPKEGMATVVANYDGPLYIIVAKSFYNPEIIKNTFSVPIPTEYFAAHFPLFPILIKAFSFIFGYPYSMLVVTLISSVVATYFFYKLVSDTTSEANAIWLTFVFSVFPARWLIVRSVGSPEPLFVASIIASIYNFRKEKYLKAGLWGATAQATKSPGILLFVAYFLYIFLKEFQKFATSHLGTWFGKINPRSLSIFLIPASLLGVFVLYRETLNNFFAYFNSGDNIHLFFPPFQVFNYKAPWVNTHWLEEIIFLYIISIIGVVKLAKKEKVMAFFAGTFLFSIFFVSHRDIMRYASPIFPFLILAFADTLSKKEFKIALFLVIIPIYLFALAFISNNAMPIPDWTPYL